MLFARNHIYLPKLSRFRPKIKSSTILKQHCCPIGFIGRYFKWLRLHGSMEQAIKDIFSDTSYLSRKRSSKVLQLSLQPNRPRKRQNNASPLRFSHLIPSSVHPIITRKQHCCLIGFIGKWIFMRQVFSWWSGMGSICWSGWGNVRISFNFLDYVL